LPALPNKSSAAGDALYDLCEQWNPFRLPLSS
jgi:hypothetical protein